ncbi:dehydrogenase/reductase SDR family member 4-like [Bolinopsis microptera]|uniref:dehydrogenase/reductase SDR family member 4-like n=1 Tax=Bolinopsis microptera TaxID=2820187 RepID=UPI00307A91EE
MACSRLVNKVAVVTGSSAGIGFSIAKRLAYEGASVVISSRKDENVQKAVSLCLDEGLDVSGVVCNVSEPEDRENLAKHVNEKYGKMDILVSNVGTNPHFGPVNMCDEKTWGKIFYNNVTCSALLAAKFTPFLAQSGNGNIVFVSSVSGFCPMPFIGAYSVSKAALMSLTKALSVELASANVRVNCIAPGIIETDFSSALTSNPEILKKTLNNVPMRRVGKPDECAGAVAFLVSDDASYITGETVKMDGGIPVRF